MLSKLVTQITTDRHTHTHTHGERELMLSIGFL